MAILILHLLFAHFRLAKCGNATTSSICTKTPHPKLCNTLRSTFPHKTLDENVVGLRDLSLRATLAHAANAHNLMSEMDLSLFDELGLSAWSDCLELHQDSIHHLNRSVGSNIDAFDAQTWLSAAIANEQTCHDGFLDFNLSSHLDSFQLMLGDFSKSLSNSLAINKAVVSSSSSSSAALVDDENDHSFKERRNYDDHHFPGWVSAGDRRLLRSSGRSLKADIVVAQDGSGDYTTISEASGAAKRRRRGSRRFVIYVKKGVYVENVEIKKSMKNLMFIGDGIDATVVTGNRNVRDGFTTFRSATFGENLITNNFITILEFEQISSLLHVRDMISEHKITSHQLLIINNFLYIY